MSIRARDLKESMAELSKMSMSELRKQLAYWENLPERTPDAVENITRLRAEIDRRRPGASRRSKIKF